jgi:hypothetical protein
VAEVHQLELIAVSLDQLHTQQMVVVEVDLVIILVLLALMAVLVVLAVAVVAILLHLVLHLAVLQINHQVDHLLDMEILGERGDTRTV